MYPAVAGGEAVIVRGVVVRPVSVGHEMRHEAAVNQSPLEIGFLIGQMSGGFGLAQFADQKVVELLGPPDQCSGFEKIHRFAVDAAGLAVEFSQRRGVIQRNPGFCRGPPARRQAPSDPRR